MIRRIRLAFSFFRLVLTGEPVRSWRKLDNGKYMCDGDCGRYSLHGVCTCGLCHMLKIEENGRGRIERDTVSWAREGDTTAYMQEMPYRTHCRHERHLNEFCLACREELDCLIKELCQ